MKNILKKLGNINLIMEIISFPSSNSSIKIISEEEEKEEEEEEIEYNEKRKIYENSIETFQKKQYKKTIT